ncbi:hypothetical protein SPFL3102_01850 [Sporomusaceae bacterium FL31]|nr:hypothetical protein SPFL3101_03484 [Sporomusaceae bacterium FL31]GCE34041.1 hypothetical protein SPFL3102_01850 [Sporomusaceae bacterium]
MKKIISLAVIFFYLNIGLAAAESQQPPEAATAATNLAAVYPSAQNKLPPLPVPPALLQDAKATAAYIAAVDAYLKAAQAYVDAATNDVNALIKERNTAIESANQVAAAYNAFFKLDEKK